MYPCIFFDPKRINIERSGDIWLSETPEIAGSKSFNSSFPRLCTWVQAKDLEAKKSFVFVVVHLDHMLPETRLAQIKVLHSEIKKINTENLPVLLTGDFNEAPDCGVRAFLNQNWPELCDPWLDQFIEEQTSFHKFGKAPEDPARIDWFLHDSQISCSKIEIDQHSEAGIYPSDHYPVKVVLKL